MNQTDFNILPDNIPFYIKHGAMHDRIRTAACKIIQYLFQRKRDKRNSIPAQAAQVHPSVPGRDS